MRPFDLFSRDEATLYERVSVRPLVGPLVVDALAFWATRSNLCRVFDLSTIKMHLFQAGFITTSLIRG